MGTKKQTLSGNLLIFGIFSLLAVGSWVAFDVYRSIVKTTVPRVVQTQVRPLNPELSPEVLRSIRGRRQFDEGYLESLAPRFLSEEEAVVVPEVVVTPEVEEATEEAEVEE